MVSSCDLVDALSCTGWSMPPDEPPGGAIKISPAGRPDVAGSPASGTQEAGRMIRVADRIVVGFSGEGSGEGSGEADLSWGQRDIWLAMVRQKSWLPNGAW